jgi:hypothetical protein
MIFSSSYNITLEIKNVYIMYTKYNKCYLSYFNIVLKNTVTEKFSFHNNYTAGYIDRRPKQTNTCPFQNISRKKLSNVLK